MKQMTQRYDLRPKKRLRSRVVQGYDAINGLPIDMWNKLLFPYFHTDDLKRLREACRTFAGYRPLQAEIERRKKISAECRGVSYEMIDRIVKWQEHLPSFQFYHGRYCARLYIKYGGVKMVYASTSNSLQFLITQLMKVFTMTSYTQLTNRRFFWKKYIRVDSPAFKLRIKGLSEQKVKELLNI